MKFFFDACVSKRIARALRELGENGHYAVECLEERYEGDTEIPDPEWIRDLSRDNADWSIVTLDRKIPKRAAEKVIWREARLTTFFLVSFGDKPLEGQAASLLGHWPQIVRLAREHPAGSAFEVYYDSKKINRVDWNRR